MTRVEPDVYERAAALIERLFEAPARPKAWKEFLGALCGALSTDDAVAVLFGELQANAPAHLVAHGVEVRRAAKETPQPLLLPPPFDELPVGALFELDGPSLFGSSSFQGCVLTKEGITGHKGFALVMARIESAITGALLVVSRDPEWEPTDEDRTLMQLLRPYILRAAALGLQLSARHGDVDSLLALFDSLALGVVLLDEKSRVTFANRSAEEILGSRAGPVEQDPSLVRERRTSALRTLLRSRAVGEHRAAAYPHPGDGRPLQIVSTPLHWPGASEGLAARFTQALFLGDPELASRDTVGGLVALYGLTPAEARLASLLAAGCSLAEAAEKLAIQLSTARGVLKAVFAKTGTRRQASLVSVILATIGQIRPAVSPTTEAPGKTRRA